MFSARLVIALATVLQISTAFVTFTKSKLYDESDFAQSFDVDPPNFCDVGCRIYVSVPPSSIDIAKNIKMKDYFLDQPDTSLYDISILKNGNQKGFYEIATGTLQILFKNDNPAMATAPIAVWLVQKDVANTLTSIVYDAANLRTAPASIDVVTVMSAEPFTLRTKTQGPMISVATLSGYDAVFSDSGDDCTYVISQLDLDTYEDVQVVVQSPLVSVFFDSGDNRETLIGLTADVGNVNALDFSGVSFVASPGFMCKGDMNYFSSLYEATGAFTYSKCGWLYDVDVSVSLSADALQPVTLKDNRNNQDYAWPGSAPAVTLSQTDNIVISWTSNAPFVMLLTPSNAQSFDPDVPCPILTTPAEPERTTTPAGADVDPDRTTAPLPDDHTDVVKTTVGPDQPDHTDPEPVKTTVKVPDDHTEPPAVETTVNPDQPDKDHTAPEPVKTTSRPATADPTSLKTVHPRDISSTSTKPTSTTFKPTTSAAAECGSTLLLLTLASVFFL